jgi:hypothetical protein
MLVSKHQHRQIWKFKSRPILPDSDIAEQHGLEPSKPISSVLPRG